MTIICRRAASEAYIGKAHAQDLGAKGGNLFAAAYIKFHQAVYPIGYFIS
jgi:hypothetical protein